MITHYKTIFLLPCLLCSLLAAMDPASSSGAAPIAPNAQALTVLQEDIARSMPIMLEQAKLMGAIERNGFDVLEYEPQTPVLLYSTLQPILKLFQMFPDAAKMASAEQAQEFFQKKGLDLDAKAKTELNMSMADFIANGLSILKDARYPEKAWLMDLAFTEDLRTEIYVSRSLSITKILPINLLTHLSKRLTMMLEVAKEHPELPRCQEIATGAKEFISEMREENAAPLHATINELEASVKAYETSLEKAAN